MTNVNRIAFPNLDTGSPALATLFHQTTIYGREKLFVLISQVRKPKLKRLRTTALREAPAAKSIHPALSRNKQCIHQGPQLARDVLCGDPVRLRITQSVNTLKIFQEQDLSVSSTLMSSPCSWVHLCLGQGHSLPVEATWCFHLPPSIHSPIF